jgi:hypothetical protein
MRVARCSAWASLIFSQMRPAIWRKTSTCGLSGSDPVIALRPSGGLAGLEIQQHLAMKLRAEPLGFLSGTMMAEELAASAQGRPQSRELYRDRRCGATRRYPSFGDRSHLVLLPARHNIRLAISGTWSRARIEATSRLPEPVSNPMELVRDLSLEIIEKAPGAPGPAAVTQGADRGVARLCHRL